VSAWGWAAMAAMLVLSPGRPRTAARHRGQRCGPDRQLVVAMFVGIVAASAGLVGGWRAMALTVPLTGALGWYARQRSTAPRAEPAEPRSLAFVLEMLASALTAGSPPEQAIAAVVAAVTEHGTDRLRLAAEPLRRVGRLLQFGTDPTTAWGSVRPVPGYASVADSGRRCAGSGARLAGALATAAADLRDRHQSEALVRAERVGVWSLLPLGCCFLPAFVCLGVVPVIVGVAGQVLATGS